MDSTSTDGIVDETLWQAVREGDEQAFEQVVLRHQALVSGVAYNACGSLALSEDVAQETFWAAWRQRHSLIEPGRLKSWLCGIARNLAANARRRSTAGKLSAPIERADEVSDDAPGPDDVAMSREEEALLWSMLEAIPATYREPLILYYRQDQSVAEVAACLDLSEDAVKQRLARGRSMLRDRIADRVEAGLRRSRPGRSFTAGVMAGLSVGAVGAKSAVAGTTAAGAVAKAAVASGVSGGLLGSLVGLAGGWLGTWLPAQMAPTVRERDLILRAGRRIFLASLVFVGVLLILAKVLAGSTAYLIGWGLAMVGFQAHIAVEVIALNRRLKAIRESALIVRDPNPSAVLRSANTVASRLRGRVYRSRAGFLGFPLLDVQVADPAMGGGPNAPPTPRVARGWVAIGDDARGILLAVGSKARGLVAIGGVAIGGLSMGGASFGIVAIGGLAVGLVGIGGLAVAAFAFGGGAVGWQAFGGLAVAWDLAVGGGAVAWHAAGGGGAIAHDLIIRDLAAVDLPAARIFRWSTAHMREVQIGFVAFAVVAAILPTLLMYGRNRGEGGKASAILLAVFLAGPGCSKAESPNRVDRFSLENGLTVLARPIDGASQTALVVLYNVGGDHDPEGRSGLAHLVEHVYVTAAAGATSARSADAFFRRYPAGCNAQTGDRYTLVATVFPPAQLDDELSEAAARMAELDVTAADLDRERPRLLAEVANMFERIPALAAINNARELVRPTARGGRRGGLPAQAESLSLDDVRGHWKRYYKPRNAVLAAAGAIDPTAFRAAVAKHFNRIPAGDAPPSPGEPGATPPARGRAVATILPSGAPETASLAVAPPQPGSRLYAPFLVLAARLMKAGASGEFRVFIPLLDDPSLAAISTTVKPGETGEQAADRISALLDELVTPELRPGEPDEVERMLGLFLGTIDPPGPVLAANPYGAAFAMGRREQLGLDPARLRAGFEALDAEAVREAAADVFGPSRRAKIILKPRP